MGLTEEQKARIQQNQKEAQERRLKRRQVEENSAKNLPIAPVFLCAPSSSKINSVSVHPKQVLPGQFSYTGNTTVRPSVIKTSFDSKSLSEPSDPLVPEKMICAMISKDRFEVRCKYDPEVIKLCQTMKSKSYNGNNKTWSFTFADYDAFVQAISFNNALRKRYTLERIPVWVLKMLKSHSDPLPTHDQLEPKIDPLLWSKLFPYQRDGVAFVVSKRGRCLIADDMGLGKTIQSLGVASYYRDLWPVLIACPSSVKGTWKESIHKWMPSVLEDDVKIIQSKGDYKKNINDDCVIIISYDMMSSLQAELAEKQFQVVIFDESHQLKSREAQRTKAATKIVKKTAKLLLLSGTPALSRPKELFSQLQMLLPSKFTNFHEFAIRYCEGKYDYNRFTRNKKVFVAEGASNMEELHIVLKHTVMIRRLKKDVIQWLPDKKREMVILDKSDLKNDLEKLKNARKEMERMDLTGGARRGALLNLYRETSEVKQRCVLLYILESLEKANKLIVFLHHKSMMDYLMTGLDSAGVDFEWIEGGTSAPKRDDAVNAFQNNPATKVVLLSITAAGAGITLTAASMVIFAELFWNPGILVQAEDRAHRLGQESDVYVKYLVASGTSDDYMWPLVQEKLAVLNAVGLSKDNFSNADTTVIRDEPEQSRKLRNAILDEFFTSLLNEPIPDVDIEEYPEDEPNVKRSK